MLLEKDLIIGEVFAYDVENIISSAEEMLEECVTYTVKLLEVKANCGKDKFRILVESMQTGQTWVTDSEWLTPIHLVESLLKTLGQHEHYDLMSLTGSINEHFLHLQTYTEKKIKKVLSRMNNILVIHSMDTMHISDGMN